MRRIAELIQSDIVGRAAFMAKNVLGENRIFSDLPRLGPAPVPTPGAKRILIYSYKWWPAHVAAEAVIARALQLRGADVSFFICDHAQSACDNFRLQSKRYLTCGFCQFSTDRFIREAKFKSYQLTAYWRLDDEKMINDLPYFDQVAQLREFTLKGIRIGQAAEASALRYLRINSLDSERPRSYQVARSYLGNGIRTLLAVDRLFQEQQFDMVLLQGGKAVSEVPLIETARTHGTSYMTRDFGAILGTMMFRLNESISDVSIAPVWNAMGDRDLSPQELAQVDRYLEDRRYGKYSVINPWPNPKFSDRPIDADTVHQRGGRIFMAFTNVAWDTACSGTQAAFEHMYAWLDATIQIFLNRPKDYLLIRIHPAEVQMKRGTARDRVDTYIQSHFPNLPDHIRVLAPEDQMSTYSLLPYADTVLVYTTTVGIEAAAIGKPVITGGKAYYGDYGFCTQLNNIDHYERMLNDPSLILDGRTTAEIAALAKKWMHCYFFSLSVPFPFVRLAGRKFLPRFSFDGEEALAPGKNKILDQICKGLLDGEEIFLHD